MIANRAVRLPDVKVLSKGIETLGSAPGGGHIVTLEDAEGFPISLVYGIEPGKATPFPGRMAFNDEKDKPRQREFARFKPGPAAVHKVSRSTKPIPPSHLN